MSGPPRAGRRRLWWAAGWAVLAAFAILAAWSLPLAEAMDAFARSRWEMVALAAAVPVLVGWPLWVLQWWLLAPRAHRPSLARIAEVTALAGATNQSVPVAGAVAAVGLLVVRARLPMSAAMSVFAVDQLLVGIAKVGFLAAAAWLAPLPDWLRLAAFSLAGTVAVATVALLAAAHAGSTIRRLAIGLPERLRALAAGAADFVDHLEPMRRPLLGAAVTLLAFAKDGVDVVSVLFVQAALGIDVSLTAAILVVAALNVATLVPLAPGHFGVFEAAVIFAYQVVGVPLPLATAAAFLQHGVFFVPVLVWLAAAALMRAPRASAGPSGG